MTTDGGAHGALLEALGRRIAAGDPAAGAVLTLAGLESEYRVSRTLVRETIRVLESLGMVRSRRRIGITVQPREHWHVLGAETIRWTLEGPLRHRHLVELMELRAALEPVAARFAAERATAAQRAELVALATELDRLGRSGLGDGDAYLAVDIEFHELLLASSANALYAELAGPVREILVGRTSLGLTPAVPAAGTLDAHLSAAHAIAAGDGTAAEHAVRTHIAIVSDEIEQG